MTRPLRAVFDTNVVVSALIFGRRLAWLRTAWSGGASVPVVCRETTAELLRVLSYPKFRLTLQDREDLLQDYLPYADIHPLAAAVPPVACRDRDDAVFIALAVAAGVPLISGDGDLAVLRGLAPVEVLAPAEYRLRLQPEPPTR